MNPNEIKKALECCVSPVYDCDSCPLYGGPLQKDCVCGNHLMKNVLVYINKLEAKVERLEWDECRYIGKTIVNARNEAIKEFAESVVNDILPKFMKGHEEMALKISFEISQKAKEMVGE